MGVFANDETDTIDAASYDLSVHSRRFRCGHMSKTAMARAEPLQSGSRGSQNARKQCTYLISRSCRSTSETECTKCCLYKGKTARPHEKKTLKKKTVGRKNSLGVQISLFHIRISNSFHHSCTLPQPSSSAPLQPPHQKPSPSASIRPTSLSSAL